MAASIAGKKARICSYRFDTPGARWMRVPFRRGWVLLGLADPVRDALLYQQVRPCANNIGGPGFHLVSSDSTQEGQHTPAFTIDDRFLVRMILRVPDLPARYPLTLSTAGNAGSATASPGSASPK